ncbi:acetyltransferase [Planotetraspora thailandica]|uniref:Acetyltransferase n=1 Tax=Planotetraspora thailandica TaxID=487172 RepID=A0A8J3XYR3_9ACTN|nr:GNAT family N-acetyltransferase [Planotetraspora thailandica]GII54858.1 acetyltransferase [Planotetraspora thailandica]
MDQGISLFDRLVDEAWPAAHRTEWGNWAFRHAGGVTKRANSVLPLGEPDDLSRAVDEAEAFYARLGGPCVFSIGGGAPAGLDAELESRGYRLVDPTLVMTAPATAGSGRPAEAQIEHAPSQRWLDTWWEVDGGRHPDGGEITAKEWAARILRGVEAGYASQERASAVGRAVPQGEWLGIYCMAVLPAARRRGLGGSVLRTMLAWGGEQGASHAYLVVTERNAGARALYESEGFGVVARYHYRVRP